MTSKSAFNEPCVCGHAPRRHLSATYGPCQDCDTCRARTKPAKSEKDEAGISLRDWDVKRHDLFEIKCKRCGYATIPAALPIKLAIQEANAHEC